MDDEMRNPLAELPVSGLIARFSVENEYDDYYETVARELYTHGGVGIEVLDQELSGRRVPQVRAALTVLAMHQGDDPIFIERVGLLVSDPEPMVAGDAIRLLGLLGVSREARRIQSMRNHPAPFVRASVLDYLTRTTPKSVYPALMQGLGDTDYVVRENAVDALDDLGATEAIRMIEPLLKDSHEDVRQAARTAVNNLRERRDSSG